MATTIVFVRHGLTTDLAAGLRNRPDTPLTAVGRAQMLAAAAAVQRYDLQPDLMITSPLPRARHSAELVAGAIGYPATAMSVWTLLTERDAGAVTGWPNRLIKQRYPGGFDTVPGAEPLAALTDRAERVAAALLGLPAATVLVVSHGVFGRAVARVFLGRPPTDENARPLRADTNLANGQMMRLHPAPFRRYPAPEIGDEHDVYCQRPQRQR